MATRALIPVEVYLTSVYRPDCDYVDGEVLERNLGERDHSYIQVALAAYFFARRKALNLEVFTEQRVQVRANRYRIPDICVVLGGTKEKIFTTPPFLCIEILSKDDTMVYMQEKIDDYLRFGVPYVWIINPRLRKGYVATKSGLVEAASGILETSDPEIRVPVEELFDID